MEVSGRGWHPDGMRQRWIVQLSQDERAHLLRLSAAGQAPARKLTHARLVLKADAGPDGPGCTDEVIEVSAEALEVGTSTVERGRKR